MSRDVADLLADLDGLDGPDLWAQITDRVTTFELVGDPEADDSDELLAHEERPRRSLLLVAAVFVVAAAAVAGVLALSGGDNDPRVVTDDPEPTTVTPAPTTVPPPPTSVPLPTVGLPTFAPPPAYGYPLGTLTCCEQPTENYRFLLLGSPGEGADPFSGGDLLVLVAGANSSIGTREGDEHAVRGTTGYSGRYVDFPPAGFVGELTWREEGLGVVVLASRSFTTEELIEIAEGLALDGASLGADFPAPDGYAAVADQWYADRLGPLSLGELEDGWVPEGLTYVSTWTTGGVAEQNIRVTVKPASAESIELAAYLVADASRVPVRGATGVLGSYGESKQLSWIDGKGAMVTIMASDPSVDLVAMAESEPPAPWTQGPGQTTVLTGTREGSEWSLRVVADAHRGYDVCYELDGVDDDCRARSSGTAAGRPVTYTNYAGLPTSIDGYGFFVGGAAPSCAAQVRSGSTTVDTVAGPDGRRYFGTWDVDQEALFDPFTLEALDAAGATVGTWSRGGTWRDDRC